MKTFFFQIKTKKGKGLEQQKKINKREVGVEELVGDRGASRPWATHVQAEANANLGLKGLGIPPPPSNVPICPCIFHTRARTHHPSSGVMTFKPSL